MPKDAIRQTATQIRRFANIENKSRALAFRTQFISIPPPNRKHSSSNTHSWMCIYIMLSPANSHIPRWITHTSVLLSIWSALVAARNAVAKQTFPLKQTDKNVARAAQPQRRKKNNRSRSCCACGVHINSCVCVWICGRLICKLCMRRTLAHRHANTLTQKTTDATAGKKGEFTVIGECVCIFAVAATKLMFNQCDFCYRVCVWLCVWVCFVRSCDDNFG